MPVSFTDDQFELANRFLRGETEDLAQLDAALAIATESKNLLQLEHDLYTAMKTDALEKQDALLVAMAAALDLESPEYDHEVEYLSGHPSLGGSSPQNWRITHLDELLQLVIDKTHADATPEILDTEAQWNAFNTLQVNVLFGTIGKLSALSSNVIQLAAQRAAVEARNGYLREVE